MKTTLRVSRTDSDGRKEENILSPYVELDFRQGRIRTTEGEIERTHKGVF